MKKIALITFCFTIMAIQFSLAQSDKEIPAAVTAAFNEKYPGMKVADWDYIGGNNAYEAEFRMNDKKIEAYFADNGTWISTKTLVKIEEFPPAVFQAMTTGEYKDWTFHDYAILDTPGGKRYNMIAKYGNNTHNVMYNDEGLMVEKNVVKSK